MPENAKKTYKYPRTDKRRESERRYKEKAYKRIPLDVRLEDYELIRQAAEVEGIGVNTWIKAAITDRLGANTPEDPADKKESGE